MVKRQRIVLAALLALTAVSALILRPIGVELFDIPLDSRDIEIVGKPGTSQHCVVITDCETLLTANTTVDLTQALPFLILVGFAFVVLTTAARPESGPKPSVSSPPPKLTSL
jgi:hypothetical protein